MSEPTLPVSEQFLSIQGESSYAGKICWFIRLTGCNLRCSYCDTAYAVEPDAEHEDYTIDELVRRTIASGTNIVEITGGEPLTHPLMPALAQKLVDAGLVVLVETNGSLDISVLPEGVVRIMDIKTPSSGMSEMNRFENIEHLNALDEVKFVVGDEVDFRYACHIVETYELNHITPELRISPVTNKVSASQIAEWILESGLPFSLNLQLHKIIWPDTDRGV